MWKNLSKLSYPSLLAGAFGLVCADGSFARNSGPSLDQQWQEQMVGAQRRDEFKTRCRLDEQFSKRDSTKVSSECAEFLRTGRYPPSLTANLQAVSGRNLDWTNSSASQYPVRLKSIRWDNGHEISRSEGVCFGNWCIDSSAGQDAVAIAGNFGVFRDSRSRNYNIVDLSVTPLTCRNDVLGTLPCYMALSYSPGDRRKRCSVYVGTTPAETIRPVAQFQINCPQLYS